MFRKRQATDDYVGRHRGEQTASGQHKSSGQHKKDPLPPPDPPYRPPRTGLVSSEPTGNWSRWYAPREMRGIDPNLISPVPEIHHEEEQPTQKLPSWMEPKPKIQPRYVTAAVATALVAVPALLMAGWIASENSSASTRSVSSQLAPGTVHMPIALVVNGHKQAVCITLSNSGPHWTAWASPQKC